MIEIKKGKEPSALAAYRNLPNASYEDMHGARTGRILADGTEEKVYDIVLSRLIEDQGGICAYCMKRIPEKRGHPKASIEHIQPQNAITEAEKLDYRNMLAVCSGNRNATDNELKTCDAFRGALRPDARQKMTVNPLLAETLRGMEYSETGIISSQNPQVDDDLNNRLNLNCKALQLPACRAGALLALQEKVYEDNRGRTASKEYFQSLLNRLQNADTQKKAYVGILVSWLQTKIK